MTAEKSPEIPVRVALRALSDILSGHARRMRDRVEDTRRRRGAEAAANAAAKAQGRNVVAEDMERSARELLRVSYDDNAVKSLDDFDPVIFGWLAAYFAGEPHAWHELLAEVQDWKPELVEPVRALFKQGRHRITLELVRKPAPTDTNDDARIVRFVHALTSRPDINLEPLIQRLTQRTIIGSPATDPLFARAVEELIALGNGRVDGREIDFMGTIWKKNPNLVRDMIRLGIASRPQ